MRDRRRLCESRRYGRDLEFLRAEGSGRCYRIRDDHWCYMIRHDQRRYSIRDDHWWYMIRDDQRRFWAGYLRDDCRVSYCDDLLEHLVGAGGSGDCFADLWA